MDAEKIRNLTDAELLEQQRDLNDQLFRLKFQLRMGQTESLKKIRGLRKDVARILTIMREKQLEAGGRDLGHGRKKAAPQAEAAPAASASPAEGKKKTAKKPVAKKAAAKTRKK